MSRWGWEKGHLVRQEWVGTGVGPAHLLVSDCNSRASKLQGYPRLTQTPAWRTQLTMRTEAGLL